MSLTNVTQLIEKVNQRAAPNEFWKKGEIKIEDNKESFVFNNCLTETNTPSNNIQDRAVSEENSFNNNLDHVNNVAKADLNNFTLEPDDDSEDTDETDYFDSEDEYWESVRKKKIEDMFCSKCLRHHPQHSGHGNEDFYEYEDISHWITSPAQKFAKYNNFEIKDVYGDGNCLFRAVADQFMINGCPGHTEVSLRKTAIKHLRANPAKYGVHASSFLSGESWEDYLERMNKTGEWGDHIILQALADVFLLHITIFNVINNDIRRTEIITEMTMETSTKFHICLGHVGEYHYFSLRSMTWKMELPYKSQMYRMLVTCSENSTEEKSKMVDKTFAFMSQGCFADSCLADSAQYVLQCIHLKGNSKEQRSTKDNHVESIFMSYTENDLQFHKKEDYQRRLIEDQQHVDHVSGIPLPHLTFIMQHILPVEMFLKGGFVNGHLFQQKGVFYHFLGSFQDETEIFLRDISWKQKSNNSISTKNSSKIRRIVVLSLDKEVIYERGMQTWEPMSGHLYVDCSETLPVYCRLKLPFFDSIDNDSVVRLGSNLFQKNIAVPDRLHSQINMGFPYQIQCIGVRCFTFPFYHRWKKERQSGFPSHNVISSIVKEGCTLIPKSHPKSICPEIEWKFDFSMAEHIISKSLTNAQRHGFFVLKIMLDNIVHHLPFKTKHLKSVFLMACEEIPPNAWVKNFGGCVLYVLDSLVTCLKERFLPNYFIPENNLMDCFREDDVNTLCIIIEYIRIFPASVIQIVGEKHGYKFAANLIKRVLSQTKEFSVNKNFNVFLVELCLPLTVATAKIMARKGFYSLSFSILKRGLEQRLLVPDTNKKHESLSLCNLFESVLVEIKQKSSRVILASIYDENMGRNVSESIIKKKGFALQTFLPWAVDQWIGWLKIPKKSISHFTAIASFLYDYSKKEFWKQNSVLSELAISTAIRCIKELSTEDYLKVETFDSGSKEVRLQEQMIKKTLIPYYMHVFAVASLYRDVYLLRKYINEIENICQDFPELSSIASIMFQILGQPEKSRKYARMFDEYYYSRGREMDLGFHLHL